MIRKCPWPVAWPVAQRSYYETKSRERRLHLFTITLCRAQSFVVSSSKLRCSLESFETMDVPVYKKLVLFRPSAWPNKTWDVFTPGVTANIHYDAVLVCMSLFVFFSLDFIFVKTGWFSDDKSGRYFSLHVICNLCVSILSFADTLLVYQQPVLDSYFALQTDTSSMCIIFALHLYHIIAFRPLEVIDWVHHIVMCVVMLPLAYIMQPGPMLNHGCFFASGFPGGVDYFMLVLVKKGYMKSIDEKFYNSTIQTWIRNPGMLYHALMVWMVLVQCYGNAECEDNAMNKTMYTQTWQVTSGAYVIIFCYFWNGPYFHQRVCENYGKRLEARNK